MNKQKIINISKVALVFILFFMSKYLQYIPLLVLDMDIKNLTLQDQVIMSTFSNAVLALLLFLIYRKDLIKEWKRFKKNYQEDIDVGLRYWILGLALMVVSNILISLFTPLKNSTNEMSVQSLISVSPYIMLFTAGILAPICEEITFRKTIKELCSNKWLFCIISGLVFGLLHVVSNNASWYEYLYVIPYGSLGFTFAYAYYKTDTIFTSMSMHALHNILLVLLSILT